MVRDETVPGKRPRTFAWFLQLLRPHWWLLLVFGGSALAAHLLSTLVPVYVGRAFGEMILPAPTLSIIAQIALTVALLVCGRFCADLLSNGSMEIVAQRVKRDARDKLYRSLLAKRQSFHDRQHVGDILARAINDARFVDYMLSPGISTAFNGVVALLIPIIFISFMRMELLLAPAVLIVIFAFALGYHIKLLHPLTQRLRESFGQLNKGFSETLAGMSTVKVSTQEDYERQKFITRVEAYRNSFALRGKRQAVYLPSLSFGLGMAIGTVHSFALLTKGQLALPQVVTYLGWLALFSLPLSMSEQSVPVIQEGYVAMARMQQLIERDEHERESTEGSVTALEGAITFDRVSLSYGGKQILKDVSFHLPAGRTLAIVGPTASGKTMLTKLINRTYDATEGRVLIDGQDVRTWMPGALRRQIANVHQDIFLFSKSVFDNIAFGSHRAVNGGDVSRAAVQAHADDFIQLMEHGYDTVLNEGGTTLSGGQRQRLVIARALLADPRILVLDDATSAVDAQTEKSITEALTKLMDGRTTILISHRPSQIRRADVILLLNAGEVVDLGTHEELMRRCALYREIYSD